MHTLDEYPPIMLLFSCMFLQSQKIYTEHININWEHHVCVLGLRRQVRLFL